MAKGISGTPCPICANDIEIEAKVSDLFCSQSMAGARGFGDGVCVGHCLLVQDAALLNQFICSHSGKVLPASKTGKPWVDRQGKGGSVATRGGRV